METAESTSSPYNGPTAAKTDDSSINKETEQKESMNNNTPVKSSRNKSSSSNNNTPNSTATTNTSGANNSATIEFEPPLACVKRLLKNCLPRTNVGKDASIAFARACGIFVIYVTACANDFAREHKRTTITANDIMAAMKELDFEEFAPQLTAFLEQHRKEEKAKRDRKKALVEDKKEIDVMPDEDVEHDHHQDETSNSSIVGASKKRSRREQEEEEREDDANTTRSLAEEGADPQLEEVKEDDDDEETNYGDEDDSPQLKKNKQIDNEDNIEEEEDTGENDQDDEDMLDDT